MTEWVAVSLGVLDVREHELGAEGFELAVVPTHPGVPRFLFGAGADLWLRMVDQPLADEDITPDEREALLEMEQMGIASRDPLDDARVRQVDAPWMTSMVHELVYGLLAKVADRLGIDLIFLKGPTLHAQGLRSREHSGDVDCWVAPGNDALLARAMEAWGWVPAFSAFTGTRVLHSLTLRAGDWGCAVDVHTRFPGMAASGEDTFRTALATAEKRTFAGQTALTPGVELHAIISALNETRPFRGSAPSAESIAAAAHILSLAGPGTIDMARKVEAEFALKEELVQAFPEAGLTFEGATPPDDWAWRLEKSTLSIYLKALSLVPWSERFRVVFRVLWPTAESMRSGPTATQHPGVRVWRLRVLRAATGLRQLKGSRDDK